MALSHLPGSPDSELLRAGAICLLYPSAQHGTWLTAPAQPLSGEHNPSFSDVHTQQAQLPQREARNDCN